MELGNRPVVVLEAFARPVGSPSKMRRWLKGRMSLKR